MKYLYTLFTLCLGASLFAQATFCPTDPPGNPWLAHSPYPIYHRNSYAQASTCLPGPLPGDSLRVKVRRQIKGGTSPWTYLSDTYPGGERVLLQSNATHVFKFLDTEEGIIAVDSLRIDFEPITSFGWNFMLSRNKVWFTYDPDYDPEQNDYTRLFKLTDADTTNPYSEIIVLDTFNFGDYGINEVNGYNLNYNGQIVFNSRADEALGYAVTGIIDQDFNLLDTLQYATFPGEIVHHNSFPVQEDNAYYIVTTHRMIKFAWDGVNLSMDWSASYDFVADGPTGIYAEGSGTTPTLMGWGEGNDQLVIVADGHDRNNLVAFWRELPEGWEGVPGMDIHFADSIRLPYAKAFSNTFQSIENSPTVHGYEVAIAQFNGFLGYDCDNLKGVQKLRWDTEGNQFVLEWATDDLNMNGVLCYSSGSNLLYGSGKEEDCMYYYYALDWDSGELVMRKQLGPEGGFTDDPYYDGGNNHIIDEAGNIYFSGGASLVKLEQVPVASAVENTAAAAKPFRVYPNPAQRSLTIEHPDLHRATVALCRITGERVTGWQLHGNQMDISALTGGLYLLSVRTEASVWTQKVLLY